MLNQLKSWVKNVYNKRINSSKNSALVSTKMMSGLLKLQNQVYKTSLIHQTINYFTTNLFTSFLALSPLFEYKFYPISTAPIIKTNKERN